MSTRVVTTCTRCGEDREHYVQRNGYAHRPCVECRRAPEHVAARREERRMRHNREARAAREQSLTPAQKRIRAYQRMPAHRFKSAARRALHRALKSGRIARPDRCQGCGGQEDIEAHHHRGYEREHRLDVRWLCAACHGEEHRKP